MMLQRIALVAAMAVALLAPAAEAQWGGRRKGKGADFESLQEQAAAGGLANGAAGFSENELGETIAKMQETMLTVTTRLADILESRQLARKPTKKKLVEILRNDPVLLREVPEWSSTFEAMIEPQLVNMPENDKEFAAKLPEMQQQFREVAQQLSSPEVLEQYTDFMREAIADPTQLMGNLQGAMEEVMQSPDFEQRMEEAFNTIQDPEFMKNVEDTWRAMGSTEDQIAEMRKMWEDPAIKDQIRELFQNPEAMQETIQMMGMGGGMGGAPLGRVEL